MAVSQANSIALIIKYAPDVFDDVYKKEATSSVLQKNSANIQFTGAKTVRVAKLQLGQLHPYHRNNVGDPRVNGTTPYGYQSSAAGLTWEDHTLEMDRAAYYPIEMFDDEESGGKIVGTSITYIDQYVLVPEIDAYCWSKIYEKAGKKVVANGTWSTDDDDPINPILKPLHALNVAFKWEADHQVPENDQIVIASTSFGLALSETTEFGTTRFVNFDKGEKNKDLAFQVMSYQNREIVIVPPERFSTAYDFSGEGFTPASGAKGIDLIVMPKSAATHIVKYEKTRILEGDAATAMTHLDGYVILTRIYHDIIVFDNKRVSIYAMAGYADSAAAGSITGFGNTVSDKHEFFLNSKNAVERIIAEKGDIFTIYALNLIKSSADNDTTVTGTGTPDTTNTVAAVAGDIVSPDVYYSSCDKVAVGSKVVANDKVYILRTDGSNFKVVDVHTVTSGEITAKLFSETV